MKPADDPSELTIDDEGAPLRVLVRRNPRARRISLRADARAGGIVLVLPPRAGLSTAIGFARSQTAWIRRHLSRLPPPAPFAAGAPVALFGEALIVRHDSGLRGPALRDAGVLHVGGRPEFLSRRVRDFLRAEALRALAALAAEKAGRIGLRIASVRVADTRSRWGSCARGGRLSFSWRLAMAPPEIVDYVVAHEVAHLAHHDHGAAFWRLVDRLTPHRTHAAAWLRRHGAGLLRAGPP